MQKGQLPAQVGQARQREEFGPRCGMFFLTSAPVRDMRRWTQERTCRLCGKGSFRRRLARRDSGKMLAARVATHKGSPVSSRPQSHVLDPSVATWTAVKNHNCSKYGMRAEIGSQCANEEFLGS